MNRLKTIVMLVMLLLPACVMAQKGVHQEVLKAAKVLKGQDASMSKDAAVRLLTTAANDSNAYAMNVLGMVYLQGIGVEKNVDKAISWWMLAAQNGYAYAYHNLGMLYKNGKLGIKQDFVKACSFYKKGAEANSLACCYNYGFMLYKGLGCQQSYEEAISYFQKAAVKKHSPSLYMLGLCYRNGYGVEKDEEMGKFYLTQAANLGYRDALAELRHVNPENYMEDIMDENNEKYSIPEGFSGFFAEDLIGKYEGVLVLYDWSCKYILGEKPIFVDLKLHDGKLEGLLKVEDQLIRLNGIVSDNGKISFENTDIVLKERYVGENGSKYRIDYAELNAFGGKIRGKLGLYSLELNEPERPIYIELEKANGVWTSAERNKNDRIVVSPSPFETEFMASFTLESDIPQLDVRIFNQSGTMVNHITYGTMQKGKQEIRLAPSLRSGIYVLNIQSKTQVFRTIITKK